MVNGGVAFLRLLFFFFHLMVLVGSGYSSLGSSVRHMDGEGEGLLGL